MERARRASAAAAHAAWEALRGRAPAVPDDPLGADDVDVVDGDDEIVVRGRGQLPQGTKRAAVWFVVMPSDSEKEQYTIRKHFKKYVGNVQNSPANYFTVTPKLRPKHVRSMAHYVGMKTNLFAPFRAGFAPWRNRLPFQTCTHRRGRRLMLVAGQPVLHGSRIFILQKSS